MTDNVASLVLQHNYDQTLALSLAKSNAIEDHSAYMRLMDDLETAGRLDRLVENLPTTVEMQNREELGKGLTRPEIAVLNAYAKLKLFEDLVNTDIANDKYYDQTLVNYFPKALHGFKKSLNSHRLRTEIIASRLCNQIVDIGGPLFMTKLCEQTNGSEEEIATAFSIAYEVMQIGDLRKAISLLDNKVSADAQLALHHEIETVMQRVIGWLVRNPEKGTIEQRVKRRTDNLAHVDESWINVLSTFDSRSVKARIGRFVRSGIPMDLAQEVALLRARTTGFDVVTLVEKTDWPIRKAAELFYDVGARFKIDRLRSMSMKATPQTHWDKLAQRRIEEDFYAAQASLALNAAVFHVKKGGSSNTETGKIIDQYINSQTDRVHNYDDAFLKVSATGNWTLAKFAIINAQLRELIGT
jgi:glutamate dehydrogenase